MPVLAEKRVVLIREAHSLPDSFLERLISYLEKPSENSILILSSDSSFKKNKRYSKLSGMMKVLKADRPDAGSLKNMIRTYLKQQGVEINRDAVDLIVELKGDDTQSIRMELDKLAAYSGGKKIEAGHVEELVGRSVTETVFKLVDAINARNAGWAFRILGDLYDQKKQPHEIIGYLSWYLRVMQKIVLLSGKGEGIGRIASELGYSQAYVKRLSFQAKKYSAGRLNRWISLLIDTDRSIKTGLKQPSLAMEMLITSFLNG
jgi:DNA polymerase-3 subunit delta